MKGLGKILVGKILMIWTAAFLVSTASWGTVEASGAEDDLAIADRAAMAVAKGDRAAAMRDWEALLARGLVSGHLLYNMGVTRAEMGEKGQAMALLLAARRWLPQDPEVHSSLRAVHATVQDQLLLFIPGESSSTLAILRGLITALSPSAWHVLAALFLFCGGSLFLVDMVRTAARVKVATVLLVTLGTFSILLSFASEKVRPVWGAVVAKQAGVVQTPGGENLFALAEGAPFVYRAIKGDWVEIQLSDGRTGWVRALEVRVIR